LRMADPNSIFAALKAAKIKCGAKHNGNGNYRVELCCKVRLELKRSVFPPCSRRDCICARTRQHWNRKLSGSDESKREQPVGALACERTERAWKSPTPAP
jgi:hypothetical protein